MARFDTARRVLVLRVAFAALALLCVVGWLLARSADAKAVEDANVAAQSRTTAFATSIARSVDVRGGSLTSAAFSEAAKRAAATDATIARARLWDAAGALVASSDPKERPGRVAPDQHVRAALRGDAAIADAEAATWVPPSGGDPVSGTLTQVAVPLRVGSGSRPAGAVEVDFERSAIVSSRWQPLSIVFAVGATVFGIGFVWAMTRKIPVAPVVHKKVDPPVSATKIGHDFAARPKPSSVWVAAPSDGPPPATSVAELEAATAKIAELEDQLRRAADESERVAALEEQVAADAPEIEALRVKLVEAEARAAEAETLLVTAQDALAAAHTQVGDTRVEDEPVVDAFAEATSDVDVTEREPEPAALEHPDPVEVAAPAAEPEPEPEPEPAREPEPEPEPDPAPEPEPAPQPEPDDPTDLIAVLEARVAEAEARAQHAKEEAMQLSPEASDLRVRLARTAARKKMGSSAG